MNSLYTLFESYNYHDNILTLKDLQKQLYHTIFEVNINEEQNQIQMENY